MFYILYYQESDIPRYDQTDDRVKALGIQNSLTLRGIYSRIVESDYDEIPVTVLNAMRLNGQLFILMLFDSPDESDISFETYELKDQRFEEMVVDYWASAFPLPIGGLDDGEGILG